MRKFKVREEELDGTKYYKVYVDIDTRYFIGGVFENKDHAEALTRILNDREEMYGEKD